MKVTRLASALAMATVMASAHALPTKTFVNPDMDVTGYTLTGTGTSSYLVSFTSLSKLTGSLFGISPDVDTTMTGITLTKTGSTPLSYAAPDSGDFSFSGLSGVYKLTFSFATSAPGGFVGHIATSPVPEPESYALAGAGLLVVGFVAARRRKSI